MAALKTRTQTPQKVKALGEPVKELKKNINQKNFNNLNTTGNIKLHTRLSLNPSVRATTSNTSTLQRSNTKGDLLVRKVERKPKNPSATVSNTTSNGKNPKNPSQTSSSNNLKPDKEMIISHLDIDTGDVNSINPDGEASLKKQCKEDELKNEIENTSISIVSEVVSPNAAGVEAVLEIEDTLDIKSTTIHGSSKTIDNLPNEEEKLSTNEEKENEIEEITLNIEKKVIVQFSDIILNGSCSRVFSFLTKRENLTLIPLNRTLGKLSLNFLLEEVTKELEDSDYKLSSFKLKNYNDLYIPEEGFPAFVMSRGANRAIDLLNENIYNKIFAQGTPPSDDVKLIYRIFFYLINRGDIAQIEGQNEFWNVCSNYMMTEGSGKTGKKINLFF